jgi:hypothetical protein
MIEHQIRRLSPEEQQILQVASAAGMEFMADLSELEMSALRASDDGTEVQQLAGGMMLE